MRLNAYNIQEKAQVHLT